MSPTSPTKKIPPVHRLAAIAWLVGQLEKNTPARAAVKRARDLKGRSDGS